MRNLKEEDVLHAEKDVLHAEEEALPLASSGGGGSRETGVMQSMHNAIPAYFDGRRWRKRSPGEGGREAGGEERETEVEEALPEGEGEEGAEGKEALTREEGGVLPQEEGGVLPQELLVGAAEALVGAALTRPRDLLEHLLLQDGEGAGEEEGRERDGDGERGGEGEGEREEEKETEDDSFGGESRERRTSAATAAGLRPEKTSFESVAATCGSPTPAEREEARARERERGVSISVWRARDGCRRERGRAGKGGWSGRGYGAGSEGGRGK